jgi:hypothetical protein
MVLKDVSRVNRVRQRNVCHSRIVNSVMAGDTPIDDLELWDADLFQLNQKIARDGTSLFVRGLGI